MIKLHRVDKFSTLPWDFLRYSQRRRMIHWLGSKWSLRKFSKSPGPREIKNSSGREKFQQLGRHQVCYRGRLNTSLTRLGQNHWVSSNFYWMTNWIRHNDLTTPERRITLVAVWFELWCLKPLYRQKLVGGKRLTIWNILNSIVWFSCLLLRCCCLWFDFNFYGT